MKSSTSISFSGGQVRERFASRKERSPSLHATTSNGGGRHVAAAAEKLSTTTHGGQATLPGGRA
jgi:hypothetical protein